MKKETLFKKIRKLGYKDGGVGAHWPSSCKGMFYRRVDTKTPCACNGKDQIVVVVYQNSEVLYETIEIELVGERPNADGSGSGHWYKLSAYSIDWKEVGQIPDIEERLIRAWEAVCQ